MGDDETRLPQLAGYTRKLAFVRGLADGLRGESNPGLAGDRQLRDAYLNGWHAARLWLGDEVPAGAVWAVEG